MFIAAPLASVLSGPVTVLVAGLAGAVAAFFGFRKADEPSPDVEERIAELTQKVRRKANRSWFH